MPIFMLTFTLTCSSLIQVHVCVIQNTGSVVPRPTPFYVLWKYYKSVMKEKTESIHHVNNVRWKWGGCRGGGFHSQFNRSSQPWISSLLSWLSLSAPRLLQNPVWLVFKLICGWTPPPIPARCHSHHDCSQVFPIFHHSFVSITYYWYCKKARSTWEIG